MPRRRDVQVQSMAILATRYAQGNYPRDCHTKGYSLYFRGNVCYSYGTHFPIAVRRETDTHGVFYMFNTSKYSVSTARHKDVVLRALLSKYNFDCIVFCKKPTDGFVSRIDNVQEMENFLASYEESIAKASRARKYWHRKYHLDAAEGTKAMAKKYAKYFDCEDLLPSKLI